ncbi:MAG TPA: MFS transporter [Acidimicrobiia bacterium]|jgi:MFS family permease
MTVRERLSRLAVDVTPLRHRDFRLLWIGEIFSETGSNITLVAVYVQVQHLTGSVLAVGAIGLFQLVPFMLASLFGGPVIDRLDRRKLLLGAQGAQAVGSGLLLLGALHGNPPVALVYVAAAIVAGCAGFSLATRAAMTPNLVPPERLPSALAMNQIMWNTAQIAGPGLAALIFAAAPGGFSWAYGADFLSFAATIAAAALMRPHPPLEVTPGSGEGSSWERLKDGVRYLKGKEVLQSTFIIDLIAMIFGMPRALFPVLAATQFHAGDSVAALLFLSPSIGAVIAALASGWVHRVARQGAAIVTSVVVWGCAIVAFGLVGDRLLLACSFLAVAGGADVISAVFRSTILQATVPDDLRGRLSGIHIMVVGGGPRIGDAEAGLMASAFNPGVSVVSGGILCVLGVGVLSMVFPRFPRYRAGEPA